MKPNLLIRIMGRSGLRQAVNDYLLHPAPQGQTGDCVLSPKTFRSSGFSEA
jgi:hypothetical protein